ncbi:MAG: hypothetical protein JWO95_2981 [Verrucomicrobiales bacterium]|nr:hypothetical protein [Verrucomicrobiales bacterium]
MSLLLCAMNSESRRSELPLWPFIILDLLFLGLAYLMFKNMRQPLGAAEAAEIILCAVGAAICFALPFLRRHADETALAQVEAVAGAVNEIKKLETFGQQINLATSQWQGVQEQSTKTVAAAREVADGMAAEAKSFVEFLKKANDTEKTHLRTEVDKLRRAEGQWLEVLVRMMDNVYALHLAALQSGKSNLINQIGQFHNSCRDAARRVGLAPVVVEPGTAFDAKSLDLFEGEKASDDSKVGQTVACGYTYQGQIIRKPIVVLISEKAPEPKKPAEELLPGLTS